MMFVWRIFANMHIVTVNWPSYPLWEQIGLPLALKKNQTRPAALHKQHCPCVWKHSTGAYTARHYLSRKKTRQEPVHVPKTGTFTEKSLFPKSLPNAKESLPFLILNATASVISCTLTNNCLSPYTTAIHNISYPYGTHKPSLPDT